MALIKDAIVQEVMMIINDTVAISHPLPSSAGSYFHHFVSLCFACNWILKLSQLCMDKCRSPSLW